MNSDTKPASAVELLLDKINWMSGVINTLEARVYDLERKANQIPINLSNVVHTWSYNDLTDVPNIPNNVYEINDAYRTARAYCASTGHQAERYVTDMQNQNWNLVIQFSDGTTARLNDEWL